MDWRFQVEAWEGARGMGAMEGNLAHLIAARMKGRGRSWRREGAWNMGKLLESKANGELTDLMRGHIESIREQERTNGKGLSPGGGVLGGSRKPGCSVPSRLFRAAFLLRHLFCDFTKS